MKVEELKVGEKDVAGNTVNRIYTSIPPAYAIYQTDFGVVIHHADDRETAAKQRAQVAKLSSIRGQINTLIDGWRQSSSYKNKTFMYDARVAGALALCLEDDAGGALATLEEIKSEIALDKSYWLTFEFFFAAGVTAVLSILVMLTLLQLPVGETPVVYSLLLAGIGGISGAFFSVTLGASERTLFLYVDRKGNRAGAIVRLTLGFIAACALVLLLRSELLPGISLGNETLTNPDLGPEAILVIGFIAGFMERFVPDIFAKRLRIVDPDPGTNGEKAGGQASPGAPAPAPAAPAPAAPAPAAPAPAAPTA